MTKFTTSEIRSTVAAALLTLVCSTTLLLGTVAPAEASSPVSVAGRTA